MNELSFITTTSQSLHGSKIAGEVKAVIIRDFYDFQSYGLVQAWTDGGWKDIQRLPIDGFEVRQFSQYHSTKSDEWKDAMARDLDNLLDWGYKFLA